MYSRDSANLLLQYKDFNENNKYVTDFNSFKSTFKSFLSNESLKQQHAYAHQLYAHKTNRLTEYLKEQIQRGEGVLIIDPKSIDNNVLVK